MDTMCAGQSHYQLSAKICGRAASGRIKDTSFSQFSQKKKVDKQREDEANACCFGRLVSVQCLYADIHMVCTC